MIKVALYGTPADNPELVALGKSFQRVAWRHPHFWRDNEAENFDVVVVSGLHGKNADILRVYTARGVPVLVLDYAYLERPDYWRVSLGGLNNVPTFPCAPDRFDSLGIVIAEHGGDPNGYTLLIGQMPGDRALNGSNHMDWLIEQACHYEHVVFRPHPQAIHMSIPDVATLTGTLDKALAGARQVVTYTSNAGHEALLAGVPVLCNVTAAYATLGGATVPDVATRKAYFDRVAYGQWTVDEMANGQAMAFITGHLLTNTPMPSPEVAAPIKRASRKRRVTQ